MADDLRTPPDDTREKIVTEWAAWAAEERQTWCETRLYRIDPLLAALREVAGL